MPFEKGGKKPFAGSDEIGKPGQKKGPFSLPKSASSAGVAASKKAAKGKPFGKK